MAQKSGKKKKRGDWFSVFLNPYLIVNISTFIGFSPVLDAVNKEIKNIRSQHCKYRIDFSDTKKFDGVRHRVQDISRQLVVSIQEQVYINFAILNQDLIKNAWQLNCVMSRTCLFFIRLNLSDTDLVSVEFVAKMHGLRQLLLPVQSPSH